MSDTTCEIDMTALAPHAPNRLTRPAPSTARSPDRACRGPILAAATLAALAILSGPAVADERSCRGDLGAAVVDNLRVPDGASCVLEGTRIQGSIKVGSRALLRARQIDVVGNIQAENHAGVTVTGSRVGGSIQLVQGGSADLRANRVNGDIQLFANGAEQTVAGNRVGGNLQCKENRAAPRGSGNAVDGNKEDQCRTL